MFPLVGIPSSIISRLKGYRRVFCREAGFKHISRYISGLLLSSNKTLQGIYSHLVFPDVETVSRRAMHESIFESGWSVSELMSQHRQEVSSVHHGRGREVLASIGRCRITIQVSIFMELSAPMTMWINA